MHLLTNILLAAQATYACGHNLIQCARRVSDAKFDEVDSILITKFVCNGLKEDMCHCSRSAEDYCDVSDDKIPKFTTECEAVGLGWHSFLCDEKGMDDHRNLQTIGRKTLMREY